MVYLRGDMDSKSLRMITSFIALLPDGPDLSTVPVIYLLHGQSDNCSGWTRYTAIERYARTRDVAIIMPEVQRSYYTDMAYGVNYFKYVSQELPAFCQRIFGLSKKRELNFVMGLSMGGYGALKCALNKPEQYAGCGAFSAVTDIRRLIGNAQEEWWKHELIGMFGPSLTVPPEGDLFALAEKADPAAMPRFFMTCGEQDTLYPEDTRMAELLESRGCEIEYRHWEGAHSWDLWEKSFALAMDALLPKK